MIKTLHSSSCCYYNGDLYIAFYAGEQECVQQRVYIFVYKKGKFSLFKTLPLGSGNPVLMLFNQKLYCVYSMFTRPMVNNVFDLWRTTYTCVQDLTSPKDDKYVLSTYCCPRINPFYLSSDIVILPCYDEGIERGILFFLCKGFPPERFVCMEKFPVIQPSLVVKNNQIYVFFRNFTRGIQNFSNLSYSPFCSLQFSKAQRKVIFGNMMLSLIPNHNESISTFNDKEGNALVVYNGQPERKQLTLGFLENKNDNFEADPLLVLNEEERASYPNCCFNSKNQLVISFTSYEKSINISSNICIATISTKYDKVLSRKYITPEILNHCIQKEPDRDQEQEKSN